jgi:hypothetical protein
MLEKRINVKKNSKGRDILYDMEEEIVAKIENFKDSSATLTVIQHIYGEWDMKKNDCNMLYKRTDANTLEFEIKLKPGEERELKMHYYRRNIRPNQDPARHYRRY